MLHARIRCEARLFILIGEGGRRIFKNKVLKRIFWPKRDERVSMITWVRAGRQGFGCRQEQGFLSPLHRFHIGSGDHVASYLVVTGTTYDGGKAAGALS